MTDKKSFTVDEYTDGFPESTQEILKEIRQRIKKLAPDASELISYQIPAFKQNGKNLVYYSAWKDHISLYPIPAGDEAFQELIAPFVAGKGTLRFELDKPIPYTVIEEVVKQHLKRVLAFGR